MEPTDLPTNLPTKAIASQPLAKVSAPTLAAHSTTSLGRAQSANQTGTMRTCCTFKRIQLFTLMVAAVTIVTILLILFFFSYPSIARQRVIDGLLFKEGTEAIERFKTTKDIKNYRSSFYLFTVTNPAEVVNSGAKIKLQEIGPFVYSEYKEKEFVDYNETAGNITYRLRTRYTFDPNLSVADPTKTLVTWPNVPLISARTVLDKLSMFERSAAYFALNAAIRYKKEKPFITDTVANFLFDGSKRELFQYLQSLDVFKFIDPWPLKDNMFALLYEKNFTWNPKTDYEFTVGAGFNSAGGYHDLNRFISINGSQKLKFWQQQPPKCNQLDGTDGQFFSPFLDPQQELEVYAIGICRKVTFKYRQESAMHGLKVSRYSLDETSLQSGEKNPDNKCYCLQRDSNNASKYECSLDGLIDVSTCVAGNVLASGAHFFAGSEELYKRLDGLSPPNQSLHDLSLFVEPTTGLTLKARTPIQLNVRLERGGASIFKFFKDEKPLVLPLVWFSEDTEATNEQVSQLRNILLLLDSWLVTSILGGAIVFVLAVLVTVFTLCIRFWDSRVVEQSETEPLLGPAVTGGSSSQGTSTEDTVTMQSGMTPNRSYRTASASK